MPTTESQSPTAWAFLRAATKHWIALVGGCALVVLIGVFEKVSGKDIPLSVYLILLALLFCTACYFAWRDNRLELNKSIETGGQNRKKEFLAERLRSLLNEAGTVEYGAVSLNSIEGMGKVWRETAYHDRAKNFVKEHYGQEVADHYDKEKSKLLEALLADCYRDGAGRPVIKGEIEEVIIEKTMPEKQIIGFDYHMTIRFWLRSEAVATNFRRFELVLFAENAKHDEYKGEKELLEGLCLDRKQYQKVIGETENAPIFTRLVDYDAATPLEQWITREGWLRFVIRNFDYGEKRGAGLKFDRLELRVTDGSGKMWTLTSKPPWTNTGPNLEIKRCPSPENWVQLGSGRTRYLPPK